MTNKEGAQFCLNGPRTDLLLRQGSDHYALVFGKESIDAAWGSCLGSFRAASPSFLPSFPAPWKPSWPLLCGPERCRLSPDARRMLLSPSSPFADERINLENLRDVPSRSDPEFKLGVCLILSHFPKLPPYESLGGDRTQRDHSNLSM